MLTDIKFGLCWGERDREKERERQRERVLGVNS